MTEITKDMINAAWNEAKNRNLTGMPNDFRAILSAALSLPIDPKAEVTEEMVNKADSFLSRCGHRIQDETIKLAIQAALSSFRPSKPAPDERLMAALAMIAEGDTTIFDDELQCDVEVAMDHEEMRDIARNALSSLSASPSVVAPVGVEDELRYRIKEVFGWRKTGVLPGETLRAKAKEIRERHGNVFDMSDALSMAEKETAEEAMRLVLASPALTPAEKAGVGDGDHVPVIKGEGFNHRGGGFAGITVDGVAYTAQQVARALAK